VCACLCSWSGRSRGLPPKRLQLARVSSPRYTSHTISRPLHRCWCGHVACKPNGCCTHRIPTTTNGRGIRSHMICGRVAGRSCIKLPAVPNRARLTCSAAMSPCKSNLIRDPAAIRQVGWPHGPTSTSRAAMRRRHSAAHRHRAAHVCAAAALRSWRCQQSAWQCWASRTRTRCVCRRCECSGRKPAALAHAVPLSAPC
jgi:hypothetical protein